jgi:hypothetical protein
MQIQNIFEWKMKTLNQIAELSSCTRTHIYLSKEAFDKFLETQDEIIERENFSWNEDAVV